MNKRTRDDVYKDVSNILQSIIESSHEWITFESLGWALTRSAEYKKLVKEMAGMPGKVPTDKYITKKAVSFSGYGGIAALKKAFPTVAKRKMEMLSSFYSNGCSLCGETAKFCLQPHHVDPKDKLFNVSEGKEDRITLEQFEEELGKCICVCANCHRKIHAGVIPLDKGSEMAVDEAARAAARKDTQKHIDQVRVYLSAVITELLSRTHHHDESKLEQPELDLFAEWGPKLKELEYGSEEYRNALKQMGGALQHHYEKNSHHPEHHKNGVAGMTLIDLLEMTCDWMASTKRVKGGSLAQSLEVNQKRFGLSSMLVQVIANTARVLEPED